MVHGGRDAGGWTPDDTVAAEADLDLDDDAQRTLLELGITAAGIGTFDWDLVTGRLGWDDRMLVMFGYDPDTFDGTIEGFNSRLHPDDRPIVGELLQQAIDDCEDYQAEYRVVLPEQGMRWIQARGRVLCDEDGAAVRMLGAAWDVTAQRQARERQERAVARELLLARIADELIGTVDPEEAGATLAQLIVPVLGTWCAVLLPDPDRHPQAPTRLQHAGSCHEDPAKRPLVETLARTLLQDLADEIAVQRSVRGTTPVVLDRQATEDAVAGLAPGPARRLLEELAPAAIAWLPLVRSQGRVGWICVVNDADRGPFSAEDLTTLRHVAARTALALDNARLYRQQQALAEQLQRSLLTAPPEPDHVQVVVRYQPAAEAAEVGGDWYDAFIQPDGATVLVIGDVVGHDTEAAVAMAQMRAIVRTLGAVSNDGPAAILTKTDSVMATLAVPTVATAVVARLEQTPGEREQGLTRLRWSNAGHPPPMVVHPDGTVQELLADRVDLLLGVGAQNGRREYEATLARGTMVLLYTDGLVERRAQPIDLGLRRLRDALADLAGQDLDHLCDELIGRMVPDRPEDDVALVAVLLHHQDRPRPPEAGPVRSTPEA